MRSHSKRNCAPRREFLFRSNLSPALARALQALFHGEHKIISLREKFSPTVSDTEWIATLSREARWIVFSGDRRITRNRAEYLAFRQSRLVGMFFSSGLYKSPVRKQAERLLALWDSIVTVGEKVEGGALFELPMKSTRLRQMKD